MLALLPWRFVRATMRAIRQARPVTCTAATYACPPTPDNLQLQHEFTVWAKLKRRWHSKHADYGSKVTELKAWGGTIEVKEINLKRAAMIDPAKLDLYVKGVNVTASYRGEPIQAFNTAEEYRMLGVEPPEPKPFRDYGMSSKVFEDIIRTPRTYMRRRHERYGEQHYCLRCEDHFGLQWGCSCGLNPRET